MLWSGRFSKELNKKVLDFTKSIELDKRLYYYDILGSIAHIKSLAEIGVISKRELKTITQGLEGIRRDFDSGKFKFSDSDEDIHMAVERRLIQKVGDIGKKLHTGRSRNDQVSLDMRMYLKDTIKLITKEIDGFISVLKQIAEKNIKIIMPGYTHLQQAQPIRFAHYLLAYVEMFKRDRERYFDVYKRCDVMPLGAGALAGTPYKVNRQKMAKSLGFSKISHNSMDTVSDRDFILDFLFVSSVFVMHTTRMAQDFIIWSSQEFGFMELDDAYTTGSSIMPQKKNPDVLELIRAKSERVISSLNAFLNVMKSLPLTYNRDMQEDKFYLFNTADLVNDFLIIFPNIIKTMKINKERMHQALDNGYLYATAIADYLVSKNIAFRTAHKIVGKLVQYAISKQKRFKDLSLEEYKKFSKVFKSDIYDVLNAEKIVESQRIDGGTSMSSVRKQLLTALGLIIG